MDVTDHIVQTVLPTVATAALLLWFRDPGARAPRDGSSTSRRWTRAWWALFVVTRIAYPILIFVVLDVDLASDSWFWKKSSAAALEAGRASVDSAWAYGPALAWAQYAARALTPGHHWVTTLLPFVIGDAIAIAVAPRLARAAGVKAARDWTVGWLVLSPLLWQQLVVRGQDESLFLGMTLLAAVTVVARRPILTGVVLGAAVLLTKLTVLPFAAAVAVAYMPRLRDVICAGAASALVAGAGYLALGGDFPAHVVRENTGVGITATDLLGRVTGLPFGALLGIFAATSLGFVALLALRGHSITPGRRVVLALAGVQCVAMLFMPACRSPYVAQGILPVLLIAATLPTARARSISVTALIILGWVVTQVWTMWPAFTVPLKPLSLATHGYLLWTCIRELIASPGLAGRASAGHAGSAGNSTPARP